MWLLYAQVITIKWTQSCIDSGEIPIPLDWLMIWLIRVCGKFTFPPHDGVFSAVASFLWTVDEVGFVYSARVVLVHLSGAGAPLVTRATPEGNYIWARTADRAAVIRISINHEEWSGQRGESAREHVPRARCATFNDWFLIHDWFFTYEPGVNVQLSLFGDVLIITSNSSGA